uniref:glypican-1b n=1 Tax=Monopterus albus TaxID=43700 RepID=UPI0009B4B885|nr:glypican-1-like [Monopterus albus]
MDSFIIVALALGSLTVPACGDKGTSKARSCLDIRQFYSGKGFPLDGVPQSEISGEHLRICPQGYTCCTSDMEDNLATLSRREMEVFLKETGRSLQISLSGHYKSFDVSLQETFTQTWGSVYTQNSQVFSDLYTDLRRYYRGANINLDEVINEFWTKLMEKLFYQANKQYVIGEDYLECVSKKIDTLRPFGDISHIMKMLVTRAFVAARSFVQGLMVSGDVVRKVSQVQLSPECMRAMMKMTYCPHCRGMPSARPCANYCRNVMKGCLANQADLNTEWRHLAETMIEVAGSVDGPAGMDNIVLSLPSRISTAIFTMVYNMETINSKLFQACGNLQEGGTSSTGGSEMMRKGKVMVEDNLESSSDKMGKLVSAVTVRLTDMQSHWVSLPGLLCSDRVATGTGAEDKCWNGMSRARYLPEVMGDGLASQINNPEVEIDITKPDISIRQQIMQLKIMTHRLKNALNGRDVDFQDTSEYFAHHSPPVSKQRVCSPGPRISVPNTDRPRHNPPPPEKEGVKTSANQNLPSINIYLLSLLILLLRR